MRTNSFPSLFLLIFLINFTSCFNFQDQGSLNIQDDLIQMTIHTVNSLEKEILKIEQEHIIVTTPLKYHLNSKSFMKWYQKLKTIKFQDNHDSHDLSKMSLLRTLEINSKGFSHFIELFSIDESFFIKLRLQNLQDKKTTHTSGYIFKEKANILMTQLISFQSKKLFLPKSFKAIKYTDNERTIKLEESQAQTVFECLGFFISEQTDFHGSIDPKIAYKYVI